MSLGFNELMIPLVLAHLSVLLNICQEIGTETCNLYNVFPPGDLWFGSDSEHEPGSHI